MSLCHTVSYYSMVRYPSTQSHHIADQIFHPYDNPITLNPVKAPAYLCWYSGVSDLVEELWVSLCHTVSYYSMVRYPSTQSHIANQIFQSYVKNVNLVIVPAYLCW